MKFHDFLMIFSELRVATSQLDLNSLTFPDFFGAVFPDLTTHIRWVSHEIPSEARKNVAPATTGF